MTHHVRTNEVYFYTIYDGQAYRILCYFEDEPPSRATPILKGYDSREEADYDAEVLRSRAGTIRRNWQHIPRRDHYPEGSPA